MVLPMFYFIIEENRALFTSLRFRFTFSVIDHLHEKPKTSFNSNLWFSEPLGSVAKRPLSQMAQSN